MVLYKGVLDDNAERLLSEGAPPLNIPEPTTLALLGIGLLPAALRRARRRRAV